MGALASFWSDLRWLSPAHRATIVVLAVVATIAAVFSSNIPLLRSTEKALYDLRATNSAQTSDTDMRMALVVYTPATLRATGQISPVDRTILAKALAQLDELHPKAVGIDILFDSPQNDDLLLQAALRSMRTPTFLAYADAKANPEAVTVEQERSLKNYVAAVGNPRVRSASILLETDSDDVARRWPRVVEGMPPLLAVAMANAAQQADHRFDGYTGPIRYRLPVSSDRPLFNKVPIDILADPESARQVADVFRDRFVLIGGDFADVDQFDTPFTRVGNPITLDRKMTGLEIHASMLTQLIDSAIVIENMPFPLQIGITGISLVFGIIIAVVFERRICILLISILQFGILLAFGFWLASRGTVGLNLAGWVFAMVVGLFIARSVRRAASWEKGRTATLALHRYLPPDIAKSIVTQPDRLGLGGELRNVFVMFTDLEGFTKMCQKVEPQVVAEFLNDYLECICQVILDHGGTIDKFVGDAVVAFWGAPLSTPGDGRRAVEASLAIERETARLIGNELAPGAEVGRTRVGIHYGTAIVGNFGGKGRLQYTALGDTMNVGARLEGANKELATSILVSGELVSQVPDLLFRRMGRVTVRGRSAPIDVFEPTTVLDQVGVNRLNGFYDATLRGEPGALDALCSWAEAHPGDVAMATLVRRLREGELDTATSV